MILEIAEEVAAALRERRPVVALETSVVAQGLPPPTNLEAARRCAAAVRAGGAVPAAVAVIEGSIKVGASEAELERLADPARKAAKATSRDLAALCAWKRDAGTTVSATCAIAERAGIRVFATGGIGGVHRGDSGDVSSDLTTLAREPVAVVSAGCKAILDLPRTLEMLETLAVPIVGVRTNEFPAFYTYTSGLPLEHRVETAAEAARICQGHWSLGQAGILFANPIPRAHALDAETIRRAVEEALADAARSGVRGKALTPHLLAFVSRATQKRSLAANRVLALNNATFGAELAAALAALPAT